MDLNPLTEMPTSEDLKSGDSFFHYPPPWNFDELHPTPGQIDQAPNGNDF